MKTLKLLFTFVVISLIFISCKNEVTSETTDVADIKVAEAAKTEVDNAEIAKAEFTIEGMTCAMGCAKRIEKKLAEMDGVKSAKVHFDNKLAMVEYEEGKITTTSLEETVKGAGDAYSVTEMKTVESFTSSEAKGEVKTHECSKECEKKGCTAEMKAACKKDCKKACCAKKA